MLSAVVRTAGSLPGVLGVVDQYGSPKVVVADVVLVAWLKWRHREIAIHGGIARLPGDEA